VVGDRQHIRRCCFAQRDDIEDHSMAIRSLASHEAQFVTVAELAEYWGVSRQQIYKRIDSGALAAICLGSRLYRIRTATALAFERQASVKTDAHPHKTTPETSGPPIARPVLPHRIGPQRVLKGERQ
jgi:excisionase family DNA binding protein